MIKTDFGIKSFRKSQGHYTVERSMGRRQLWVSIGAVIIGLVYFGVLMGASQGLVAVNAKLTPAIPWFPAPALLLIALTTRWLQRFWDIRLVTPVPRSTTAVRAKVYAFALTANFAALCIGVLEDSFYGLTRVSPVTSASGFDLSFVIVVPFIAAILAEIGFRGIMQTQLEKLLPLWPVLLGLAVLNALFHLYDPEQSAHWARFLALNIGFGYVTYLAQSIVPALIAHVAMNVVEPLTEFIWGPISMGELESSTLMLALVLGILALAVSIFLARNVLQEKLNA
jgi:membrane protease YdiL (CAAX protease family)